MMNQKQIEKLESTGYRRWQKGEMDRLYINPRELGLEIEYYSTGNVRHAEFNGLHISNAEARRIMGGKYYIDVITGKVNVSGNADNADKIKAIMEKMLEETGCNETAA